MYFILGRWGCVMFTKKLNGCHYNYFKQFVTKYVENDFDRCRRVILRSIHFSHIFLRREIEKAMIRAKHKILDAEMCRKTKKLL